MDPSTDLKIIDLSVRDVEGMPDEVHRDFDTVPWDQFASAPEGQVSWGRGGLGTQDHEWHITFIHAKTLRADMWVLPPLIAKIITATADHAVERLRMEFRCLLQVDRWRS